MTSLRNRLVTAAAVASFAVALTHPAPNSQEQSAYLDAALTMEHLAEATLPPLRHLIGALGSMRDEVAYFTCEILHAVLEPCRWQASERANLPPVRSNRPWTL